MLPLKLQQTIATDRIQLSTVCRKLKKTWKRVVLSLLVLKLMTKILIELLILITVKLVTCMHANLMFTSQQQIMRLKFFLTLDFLIFKVAWEQRNSASPKKPLYFWWNSSFIAQETTMSLLQVPGTEFESGSSRSHSASSSVRSGSIRSHIHFKTTVRMLAPIIWSRIQAKKKVCFNHD